MYTDCANGKAQSLRDKEINMKLNAVWYNENLILIFKAENFNEKTRQILEECFSGRSEYLYDIQQEKFYLSYQKRIDDEIESLGHSFFPLASYEANEKSRRETITKVLNEKTWNSRECDRQ